ncbi:MAG: AAA family ATPase [Chloroflexi bacterium]|nr:AAA family ATPase [Chloroflexota bacterium]
MGTQPLIGRHAELERIGAVLAFRDAFPAGILLHGREGIGKTALWREAVRRSHELGYRVLECALSRNESRLTFAGLADLIGPALDEVLPKIAPPQARALETALAIASSDASPSDEQAVAFGLHGALSVLASRSPIVLAVDDIQWLDPSSTLMLSYAIRRLRRESVVLLFALRDGEALDHQTALAGGAGVDLERIFVGPLPLGAIHRMIRTQLGYSLTRPQLLRIHAVSEGNPLHALELARAIESGRADAPDALLMLLANRVASLPETAHLALAFAAIATDTDIEALSAAYGPNLRQDLQPSIDADLLTIARGRVSFTHPLVVSAAEASVPDTTRSELHRRLAGATASEEVRAAHLAQATQVPNAEVADTLERAARGIRRRGARAASAALFEAAARVTPPGQPHDDAGRRLAAAEAWFEAGDPGRAEGILTSLRAELPTGDQRSEATWRLGIILDEGGRWQEATAIWREALAETMDPGLVSQIQCSLAITAFYTESVQDGVTRAAAAVMAAEQSASPAFLARALAVQALTMSISGSGDYRQVIERALALEAGLDESLGDWSPSGVAAECARHSGDEMGARRHYATVLERAVNMGDANVEQWAAFGLASAELLAGNYGRASELADSVLDLADQTGVMRIPARSLRAHVDAHLGKLDAARSLVAEAIDGATKAGEATHMFGCQVVLGVIEVCSGEFAAAARAYAEARRLAVEIGLAHATVLRAFLNEVEVAAATGNIPQAQEALATFEATVHGDPPPWSASILRRARASLLAARGDLRGAQIELEQPLDDESVLPLDRARLLLALGSVCRRLREFSRARDMLERALEIFTELDTPPWIERAGRELQRISGRRPRQADQLTEGEARIAEFVAAGRSNKEVAAALFVSVKTVEVTLTRVYQKVGVRSRAELAAHFSSRAESTSKD